MVLAINSLERYEEWLEARIKPLNISLDYFESFPYGKENGQYREKKYEEKGFSTPSGKVEIYSEKLKSYGYEPLPVYEKPLESAVFSPEIAQKYSLVITERREEAPLYALRHRDLPSLKKGETGTSAVHAS
jgi:anaerobic selenocysteine-containing dehydrogenase